MSGLFAVVLAAGQGKRMRSRLPKVLMPMAGRPLVHYPIARALEAGARQVVVVVSEVSRERVEAHVRAAFPAGAVTTAVQEVARGTGDAARVGLDALPANAGRVLVLCGDTPLVQADDFAALARLLDAPGVSFAVLSADMEDPRGYGRVLRDGAGRVVAIREDRDLTADERTRLREVNSGVYAASAATLRDGLATLRPDNAQGEYYLTDVVAFAAKSGGAAALSGNPDALVGVNDPREFARAEDRLFARIRDRHGVAGALIRGDARIDDAVEIAPGARIDAGVHLRGNTKIGADAVIDVGSVLTDVTVAEGALLKPYTVATDSTIGVRAEIGPFSHLRPGSDIEEAAHLGNFVETKKTRVRRGAKANHLSYLGNGDIGEGANVGAGTIFCNYDGFAKHETIIGAGAFIGSDSKIVAPVTIGKGAYVATGTTVTRDVPDDALAVGRVKQENKAGYASRLKSRLAAKKK